MNLSLILFLIGILGSVLNRKNIILMLISIEIMLLAITFLISVSSLSFNDILGRIYAIMYLAIIVLPILSSIVSGFFGRKVGVSGAQLVKLFNSVKWILNSPPKPHSFVSLPLQSKVSPFTSTTLSKNVAVKTGVSSKDTSFNNKVLEDTPRLANDKEIIKNEYIKKIHKETFLEDEILNDTHKLRSGEILEKESINKPFYNNEEQQTHHTEESYVPTQDNFPFCHMEPSMTEISSIESQALNKMAHLTRILEELEESESLLDKEEIMSVMLEISEIWWFLFMFLMLILGLLSIIIYLLNKAKIKYLSKLSAKIKYINLTKTLAYFSLECKKVKIFFKSLYSIKLLESLKNAIDSMKSIADFYKVIKYIANKFYYLNRSNHMPVSDFFNSDFLDRNRSIEKRDFIIRNMARYSSNITVYTMYTMYGSGHLDMSYVERHIRFNFHKEFDINKQLNIPRYMDYLERTNLLLDLMFSYASLRNLAYAYKYIVDYSADSGLNSNKVSLHNVHKFIWLARELGNTYSDYVTIFKLDRLVQCINLYEQSLDERREQLIDVNTRYEYLEEIITIVENILKRLCPQAVTLEFIVYDTENTPQDQVASYYFGHYSNYTG